MKSILTCKYMQMDTQAQQFFKSAVAEVAKSIQSKRFSSRRSSRSGEEDWNNYVSECVEEFMRECPCMSHIEPPTTPMHMQAFDVTYGKLV